MRFTSLALITILQSSSTVEVVVDAFSPPTFASRRNGGVGNSALGNNNGVDAARASGGYVEGRVSSVGADKMASLRMHEGEYEHLEEGDSSANVNSQQPTRNSSESTKQLQKKASGGLTASLLGAAPALYASKALAYVGSAVGLATAVFTNVGLDGASVIDDIKQQQQQQQSSLTTVDVSVSSKIYGVNTMDATSGATRPSAISSAFTFLASDTDATDTVAAKVAEAAVEEDEGDSIVGNFFEMMADNIEKKEEEKAKKAVDVDSIAEEAKLSAAAAEKAKEDTKLEEERLKAEANRKAIAEARAKKDSEEKAAEQARLKKEEEKNAADTKIAEEARMKAESDKKAAEAKAAEEAKLKKEEDERRASEAKAAEEDRIRKDTEEKRIAEAKALEEQRAADAKLKAEQEKKVAEEKALSEKRAAEEGKRLALEQEAKEAADAARRKVEDEQRIKAEEERIRAEEEATKAAEIARLKVEEEARRQLEKERSRIEEEAKKAAEMARLKVEEEAKIRADEARVAAQKLADEVAQRAADAVLNPKLELPKLELDFPEFELNLPKLELDLPDIGDFEITDSVKLGVSGVLIAGVAAAVASQAGNDDESYGNDDGIVREWKDDNTQPYGLRDNEGMNSSPRSLKGMSDMPKSSGPQSTKSSFGPGQSGGSPGMKMKSSSPFGAPSGGMGMKGNTSTMPKSPMQKQSFGAAGSSPAYKQGSSPFGAPAGSMGKTSTMSMNKGDSGGLGMKGKSSSTPMNKQGSSTFGAPSGSMGKTSTMTMNKGVGSGLGLKGAVPSGGIGKTSTMPMSKGFGTTDPGESSRTQKQSFAMEGKDSSTSPRNKSFEFIPGSSPMQKKPFKSPGHEGLIPSSPLGGLGSKDSSSPMNKGFGFGRV
eukprot:g14584.t1 g14584   contig9:2199972-2203789(-)